MLAGDHGTGIGQDLLDRVLQADPAFLWVEHSNARAVAFYRCNGLGFDGLTTVDPLAPAITDTLMVRRWSRGTARLRSVPASFRYSPPASSG